jgi:hypothetical protein
MTSRKHVEIILLDLIPYTPLIGLNTKFAITNWDYLDTSPLVDGSAMVQ